MIIIKYSYTEPKDPGTKLIESLYDFLNVLRTWREEEDKEETPKSKPVIKREIPISDSHIKKEILKSKPVINTGIPVSNIQDKKEDYSNVLEIEHVI